MKNYHIYKHARVYTIKELLCLCNEKSGERNAFAYQIKKEDISISFSEFKVQVEAFGTYLFSQGFDGKHIAVFGENSYMWILTHFAVTCGGNVIIPIDKELDTDSIVELLTDSESRVLVYSDTYVDIAEELQAKLPNITYINMQDIPECIEQGKKLISDGYTEYINKEVKKDDLASIVYTSGTTGKSKGVMLTHNNIRSCMYGAC